MYTTRGAGRGGGAQRAEGQRYVTGLRATRFFFNICFYLINVFSLFFSLLLSLSLAGAD